MVQGFRFRVGGLGFRVLGPGFKFRVSGFRFRVWGFGLRDLEEKNPASFACARHVTVPVEQFWHILDSKDLDFRYDNLKLSSCSNFARQRMWIKDLG